MNPKIFSYIILFIIVVYICVALFAFIIHTDAKDTADEEFEYITLTPSVVKPKEPEPIDLTSEMDELKNGLEAIVEPVEEDSMDKPVDNVVEEKPVEPTVEPEKESEPEDEEEPEEESTRLPCNDDVYVVVNGITVTNRELHMLGLTIWGEANGQTKMEQAAVAWSILNRVDDTDGVGYARGRSLTYVITFPGYAPGQIHGYWNTKGARCSDYYLDLAKDVVDRWALEHSGVENVGRVLPKEYTYWAGKKVDGEWHNYFRTAYKTNEPRWDWSLPNPYEDINN